MDIITNLKKEFKGKRSLTKLKINLKDELDKNVERIFKFIAKDIDNVDLSNVNDYMKFNNFYFELDDLSIDETKGIVKCFDKKSKIKHKGYNFALEDGYDGYMNISIVPTANISARARKYTWKFKGKTIKIMDIQTLYSTLKALDIVYQEVNSRADEFTSEEFKKISNFNRNYDIKTIRNLIIPETFNGKREAISLDRDTKELIVDTFLLMQISNYNIELMEKYNKEINSEVARAFETKKNIPQKTLDVMNNNKFLGDFSYVEIDQDTDLEKFKKIEEEYLRVRTIFTNEIEKAELRFRKLGKHHALGLYYPQLKCMCVDISSPKSFMHELGHHIDYTYGEGQLSLGKKFYPLLKSYRNAYESYLENQDEENSYLKRKRGYFLTPTEIFARSFEIYLVESGLKTSLLKSKDDMTINNGYPELDERFKKEIHRYFDDILDIKISNIEKSEKVKDEIKEASNELKVIIEEIKYSSLEQIGFAI